jgi:molecular chaperone GrpE (heat shock protein)
MLRVWSNTLSRRFLSKSSLSLTSSSLPRRRFITVSHILRSKVDEATKESQAEPVNGEDEPGPSEESEIENKEYKAALEKLEKLQAEVDASHRKLLLKYADAENKRRERVEEIKNRDAKYIKSFGEKVQEIHESLNKVCELSQSKASLLDADEKVKSFTEGLVMTRGIMKNILVKHNIVKE